MNARNLYFLIIISVVILLLVLISTAPKITKVKSQDIFLELKLSAEKHGFSMQNVYLTRENRLQGEINNMVIIFSREKSFDEQMLSLQKLIKSSTINSNTKQIDFRFNKIVVQ